MLLSISLLLLLMVLLITKKTQKKPTIILLIIIISEQRESYLACVWSIKHGSIFAVTRFYVLGINTLLSLYVFIYPYVWELQSANIILFRFWLDYCRTLFFFHLTGPDGVVAMSSPNGQVGTGFASRYRLQPRGIFKGPMGRGKATTPSSLPLTSNRVTTNY